MGGRLGAGATCEGWREDRLLSEPHFARALDLTAMSLAGEANEEFRLAQEALAGDAWALLEMANMLRAEGQNHYAVTAASKMLSLSPRLAGAVPEAVQRQLYPLEYRPLLEAAAKAVQSGPAPAGFTDPAGEPLLRGSHLVGRR